MDAQRGRQPGDAGADDHDVVGQVHGAARLVGAVGQVDVDAAPWLSLSASTSRARPSSA